MKTYSADNQNVIRNLVIVFLLVSCVSRAKAQSASISSSLNPSQFGQSVTFTAQVAGESNLAGRFQFFDGAGLNPTSLGFSSVDSNGVGSFTTTSLSVGTHAISAAYEAPNGSSVGELPLQQVVTPGANAGVDLGRVNVGSSGGGSATVTINTAAMLGSISVRFMGAEGLDFTDAGNDTCVVGIAYAANATCTVNVTFTPRLAGQRRGAVVLLDMSGNVIGTEYVRGTGGGPQATILTGTGVATGIPFPLTDYSVAVDAGDTVLQAQLSGIGIWKPVGGQYQMESALPFSDYGGSAFNGAGFIYATDGSLAPALYIPAPAGGGTNGSSWTVLYCPNYGPQFPSSYATDGAGNGYEMGNPTSAGGLEGISFSTGTCTNFPPPAGAQCCDRSYSAITVTPSGNIINLVDQSVFVPSLFSQSTQILPQLKAPASPVSDGTGNIFVADGTISQGNPAYPATGTQSVYLAAPQPDGTYKIFGSIANHVGALALDGNGNLFTDGGAYKFNLLNPSPVSFGSVGAGQSTVSQVMTVANTGNGPLSISSVSYPVDFPEASGGLGECAAGQTIAVGSACTLTVTFRPPTVLSGGSSQSFSEKITLISNSLNGAATEQDIPLTGTATLPTPAVTLISSTNPAPAGGSVVFIARVTGASGGAAPAGTVSFLDGNATLGSAAISGGGASYTAAGLAQGSHSITAQYGGDSGYLAAASSALTQLIDVAAVTPVITWPTPAAIAYGTALSSTQLDARASVPGTFLYSPPAGSVQAAGTHALSVTFTPTDTIHYNSGTATVSLDVTSTGFSFVTVTPCRLADTRLGSGAFGAPALGAGATREFDVPQSGCGIPSTAVAYSLNVTVVPGTTLNYLTMWPSGTAQPNVSTLNSYDGRIKANAAIVPAGTNGGVNVFTSDASNVILDINGYFVPAGTASGLAFFPLTPCRIADTRGGSGALGGPFVSGQTSRSFPVQSSNCGIPATAQAYSLNLTTIAHSTLNYLTTWPTGEAQPNVSTLNAPTGAVTANAAIVPAGTSGDVSLFVSDDADVILDINGYFAPAATGGLSLYPVTPCRVLDTRGALGVFNGVLQATVETSTCALPAAAQGYVLNATIVPPGPLNYLTLWPDGEGQPNVSTLNANDAAVTSNMAIVPTANGKIDAFSSDPAQLILDISSYFAP